MGFVKKIWKDRKTEFPGRRRLTDARTGTVTTYDVARAEGEELEAGDLMNAANMNGLEQRILEAVSSVETRLAKIEEQLIPMTQAQYDAISTKGNRMYFIRKG